MFSTLVSTVRNLTSSGNQYQKYARQNNCNLVEANGFWYLYQDGLLVAMDRHPWDAVQFLTSKYG